MWAQVSTFVDWNKIVNVSFYKPQFLWNEHCDSCVVVEKYNDNIKNEHCDSYVIVRKFNDNKRVVDFSNSQIMPTIDLIRFGMYYVPQQISSE